jgi:hypothetical protein
LCLFWLCVLLELDYSSLILSHNLYVALFQINGLKSEWNAEKDFYLKRNVAAPNAIVLSPKIAPPYLNESEDDTNDIRDGPTQQLRTSRHKGSAPLLIVNDDIPSGTRRADEEKGPTIAVKTATGPNFAKSDEEIDYDDSEAPQLFSPSPEQTRAEEELMRQYQYNLNIMRLEFEEQYKVHKEKLKRPQSASSTLTSGLSAALREKIDILQAQHDTDLAILSTTTKVAAAQQFSQVSFSLRAKRQAKLTRLAQLKEHKAASADQSENAAISLGDPRGTVEILREQSKLALESARMEAKIILEAQESHEKTLVEDNDTDSSSSSQLGPLRQSKPVLDDVDTFILLHRAKSNGAASLPRSMLSIVSVDKPSSLGRSEFESDSDSLSDDNNSAYDDQNPIGLQPVFKGVSELIREDQERQELAATLAKQIQLNPPDIEDQLHIVNLEEIFGRSASLLDNSWLESRALPKY